MWMDQIPPSQATYLQRRMEENPNYENYSKEELQRQIHGRMIVCPLIFQETQETCDAYKRHCKSIEIVTIL